MSEVGKENNSTPKRINKRKSYSILSPVNQRTLDITTNKHDRIISESTGLVKFSLSPNKREDITKISSGPTKSRGKSGLPVYVPINETVTETSEATQEELMIQYAAKQRKLIDLEKQVETTKFELAEISSKLAKDIEMPKQETNIGNTNNFNNFNNLKKKASNIFQINPGSPLRDDGVSNNGGVKTKSSTTFRPISPVKSINNFTSYFTKVQDHISQTQLNTPVLKNFVKDVRSKIEINDNDKLKTFLTSQQNEFDEFTTKTSKFVNGLLGNLSVKEDIEKENLVNSSFNFDSMEGDGDRILDTNVSLSEDDTVFGDDDEIVDIDDYNSSFEEEEIDNNMK